MEPLTLSLVKWAEYEDSGVHDQVQFSPDAAFLLAVFFHFPLALAEYFQPGGVDNQRGNFVACRDFEMDINGLIPLTDASIIRTVKWHFHQLNNRISKALHGPQRETHV